MKKVLNLILVLFASIAALGQQGTINAIVYDDATGDVLIGAVVRAVGQSGGAITGVDGSFTLTTAAGQQTLTVKYIGLPEHKQEVNIVANEITTLEIRVKGEATAALKGEVVVTASRKQNTDAALHNLQKKSVNVMDGISAQTFKKTGDNDAGQAVARVTGISVQGGKHVFVRGLGDRYTKTTLNGMIIPGLDPDRNTVQMDIFPTNVLDNIVVYKTFTPDLSGDFTGGTVDIATKAFPSKKTVSYNLSLGFNPSMHLNSDYISYQSTGMDWLAMGKNARSLPIAEGVDVTDVTLDPTANNPQLREITKSFDKTLAPTKGMNGPDARIAYSFGNRKILGEQESIGFNLALNYGKQTDYYEQAIYSTYKKPQFSETNELEKDRDQIGPQSSSTTQWSALIGGAYKKGTNKYTLSFFRTQNGESRSGQFWQTDYRENPYTMWRNNLEYTQRSVTNLLLAGKHSKDSSRTILEWKIAPTISTIDEPDIRLTAFELTDDLNPVFMIRPSVGAVATRTYRNLFEQNYNAKADVTRMFTNWNGEESKAKFGVMQTFKMRDYSIEDYRFNVQTANERITFSGDANEFLQDENIWTPAADGQQDSGIYVQGQKQASNTYNAIQNISAAYGMVELPLNSRIKTILGGRYEYALNYYTGEDQNGNRLNNEQVLNKGSFLPSVNFIYRVNSESNIRTSFTRTVARPSFKELSNAQIVDRISGRTFLGNINLVQTDIDNLDFRWEQFSKQGEMIAVSGFYKRFTNPIELVAYDDAAPNDFQPQNVGNAQLLGIEFEIKKNIPLLSKLDRYETSIGTNLTLVKSAVEMTPGEILGRTESARMGEVIQVTRDMVGQSPCIVNGFLNFKNEEKDFDMSLSYNVQGQRLTIVGVGRNPDVYETPFHSLNLKASKSFGKDGQWKTSVTARNILNSERRLEYQSYGAENQLFSLLKPMRTFSLSIGYSL